MKIHKLKIIKPCNTKKTLCGLLILILKECKYYKDLKLSNRWRDVTCKNCLKLRKELSNKIGGEK